VLGLRQKTTMFMLCGARTIAHLKLDASSGKWVFQGSCSIDRLDTATLGSIIYDPVLEQVI